MPLTTYSPGQKRSSPRRKAPSPGATTLPIQQASWLREWPEWHSSTPSLERFAKRVIRNYAGPMVQAAIEGNSCTKDCPIFNLDLFGAKYLTHCYDALQDESFVDTMIDLLTKHNDRQVFYHIRRGIPLDYEPLQRLMCDKDDYRDVFWSEQHSCWIATYWYLRRHGKITANQ